jgi:hypothetical protein
MNANKAQQLEDRPETDSGEDDYTIEGEWNRAMRALEAAQNALQNLTLLWEDEKSDEASDLASVVDGAIERLEATIG